MNRYPEYKDSGVEWIGEIPKHWDVKKIRHISLVKRGSSPRPIDDPKYFDDLNGEYSWVRISDVTSSNKYLTETLQKLSELGSSLSTKMESGDLFLSIAGSVGKPIITKIKCCIHDGFVWFDSLNFNRELLLYIFSVGTCFLGLGKMGTQLNLNTDTVGDIQLPTPSLSEQTLIAEYLDKKTSQIDTLVEKIERKIELLKEQRTALINQCVTKGLDPDVEMKDSGVEWIGKIPRHWEVTKLKYESKSPVQYGLNIESGSYVDEGVRFLRITDITEDGSITEQGVYLEEKDVPFEYFVNKWDLLFSRSGATVGKSCVFEGEEKSSFAGYLVRFTFNNEHTTKFIKYFCESSSFWSWISLQSSQSTIENVSGEKYAKLSIPFPPLPEQTLIAEYLDKKASQIDTLVEKQQNKINLLKEYRQALISNVVTGKVMVTEDMV